MNKSKDPKISFVVRTRLMQDNDLMRMRGQDFFREKISHHSL